jgi:hypothetical protein
MQDLLALGIAGLAAAWLVWRLGFGSRKPRPKRGPDVTVASLVRKTRDPKAR